MAVGVPVPDENHRLTPSHRELSHSLERDSNPNSWKKHGSVIGNTLNLISMETGLFFINVLVKHNGTIIYMQTKLGRL